jgi:hypothetical protein
MKKYGRGEPATFPVDVLVHLVAAAYGQAPADVRDWPATDFRIACRLLEITTL